MHMHEEIVKEPNCIVFSNIKFLVLPRFCQIKNLQRIGSLMTSCNFYLIQH